jgi:hypothetical protein
LHNGFKERVILQPARRHHALYPLPRHGSHAFGAGYRQQMPAVAFFLGAGQTGCPRRRACIEHPQPPHALRRLPEDLKGDAAAHGMTHHRKLLRRGP